MTREQVDELLSRGDWLAGSAVVERGLLLAAAQAMLTWLERPEHYGAEVGSRACAQLREAIAYASAKADELGGKPYGAGAYGAGTYGSPSPSAQGGT